MPRDVTLDAQTLNVGGAEAPRLDLAISVEEPGHLLALSGRLSARTVAYGRAALVEAIEGGTGDVVVDISGVQLVDASGLGVLMGAHRLAQRSERRLVLRSVPERIERLLAATHLNRVLSVEQAVRV
jgi:anti-anti-sigma factor